MKPVLLATLLLACATALAEEAPLEYRELQACGSPEESAWRPARLKVTKMKTRTVVRVDALFNCARSPKNPSVYHSPVSTTLAVEEAGIFGTKCLCRRVMEFALPEALGKGTTVYFAIEGKVYGHQVVP
jgi:hypothetical protein